MRMYEILAAFIVLDFARFQAWAETAPLDQKNLKVCIILMPIWNKSLSFNKIYNVYNMNSPFQIVLKSWDIIYIL